MAQAYPTLISSKIWDRDTTQMGANGGAHQYLGVAGWGKGSHWNLIELGGLWECLGLLNFSQCQSSNENKLTIPRSLQHLTWGKLRDIDLFIWVSYISGISDHLAVDNGEDGFDTNSITWEHESLQHVHLGSSDLIIPILLIPGSIFIKPVICLCLCIEVVAEVWWSGRSQPVGGSLRYRKIIYQFFIFSFCIVLENTEASRLCA